METVQLSHKEFLKIDKDYSKAAKVADLLYVCDKDPGIERLKKGAGFVYVFGDKPVDDEKELARIKKLAIPPAWTNVWICRKEMAIYKQPDLIFATESNTAITRFGTCCGTKQNFTTYMSLGNSCLLCD